MIRVSLLCCKGLLLRISVKKPTSLPGADEFHGEIHQNCECPEEDCDLGNDVLLPLHGMLDENSASSSVAASRIALMPAGMKVDADGAAKNRPFFAHQRKTAFTASLMKEPDEAMSFGLGAGGRVEHGNIVATDVFVVVVMGWFGLW